MTIGEKIKSLRQTEKLTQKDLGEILNVSAQAISNWERGKGYPDIANIIQISDYFKISLDILIKEDSDFRSALIEDKAEMRVDIVLSSIAWLVSLFILGASLYFCYEKGFTYQIVFGCIVGALGMFDFGKKIYDRK